MKYTQKKIFTYFYLFFAEFQFVAFLINKNRSWSSVLTTNLQNGPLFLISPVLTHRNHF